MTTDTEIQTLADALRLDGDTAQLPDGSVLKLSILPDEGYDPFLDTESYGKVEACGRYNSNRPDGFDGNGEILNSGGTAIWWQPPADAPRRGTPEFRDLRQMVLDLIEYGMQVVLLQRLDGLDFRGRPNVVESASLCGVEPFANSEYIESIVIDLLPEVLP